MGTASHRCTPSPQAEKVSRCAAHTGKEKKQTNPTRNFRIVSYLKVSSPGNKPKK